MSNRTQTILIILLLISSGLAGFVISLRQHPAVNSPTDVQTIQTFHYPATFVNQLKGDPQAGKKIFNEFCSTCHANPPRIDVHAPLIGDSKAWKIRRAMGVDVLLKIVVQGAGAMPARGGCFECSDEQLREAVRFMLRNVPLPSNAVGGEGQGGEV